jgi:FkbM family methyltransferase
MNSSIKPLVRFVFKVFNYFKRRYSYIKFRKIQKELNCQNFWSETLSEISLVDIGASYFLPNTWRIPLSSELTHLICIDPNKDNLQYLGKTLQRARVTTIPSAVSASGGAKVLYRTNVDSGSSLYQPREVTPFEMKLNPHLQDYLFPLEKIEINTLKLEEILIKEKVTSPILLKIDIQGAELEILESITSLLMSGQIIGIEVESSLLTEPIMQGSSNFSEVSSFLSSCGFELLNLNPIFVHPIGMDGSSRTKGYLNECDAFFTLKYDDNKLISLNHKIALFMTYICFGFENYAQALIDIDSDLQRHIYKKISPIELSSFMVAMSKYGFTGTE